MQYRTMIVLNRTDDSGIPSSRVLTRLGLKNEKRNSFIVQCMQSLLCYFVEHLKRD